MGKNIFGSFDDLCFGNSFSVHYREYTLGELKTLLTHAGFSIEDYFTRFLYPSSGFEKIVKNIVEYSYPILAGNLFVVGKK